MKGDETSCGWCSKTIRDDGDVDNAEWPRLTCIDCIERYPGKFAPLTPDELAWANEPWEPSAEDPTIYVRPSRKPGDVDNAKWPARKPWP